MSAQPGYVGRFAPSPTGALHLGSLVAAIGSWLDARRAGGRWLVRIDDLDRPRNQPGADAAILAELIRLGLHWDGEVTRQSSREDRYREATARLRAAGLAFPCACSRRDLVGGIYPGTCRDGLPRGAAARSLRLRVDEAPIAVRDAVQGRFVQRLRAEVGDFVVLRADGIVAYHLATVIDDHDAGVTHVVRGADLLDSTPRQIALQRALGLPAPRYAHLPLAVDAAGRKLSKQTRAPATGAARAPQLWHRVLAFLGHPPPAQLRSAPLAETVDWALAQWRLERVPARPQLPAGAVEEPCASAHAAHAGPR